MSIMIKNHPSIIHAQEISSICSPLSKLNISYFAHARINNEKKFSALSCNPEFTEHYLNKQYYTADIHMVDEKKFGDFFVWDGIEFSGKSAQMCQEAGEFGIHNPFTIIQRNKESLDYYHFANDSHNKQINQIYLANFDLLKLFISHFNESISHSRFLKNAHELTIDIDSIPQKTFEDSSIFYDREEFLKVLGIDKKDHVVKVGDISLSKRQAEILKLVHKGKTFKEIARILNLSPRTVGHYFETIKMKFNVYTRSELIGKTMILPIEK